LKLRRYGDTFGVITIRNTIFFSDTLNSFSECTNGTVLKKLFAQYFWDILSLIQKNAVDLHIACRVP